jgi:hypothetical protein
LPAGYHICFKRPVLILSRIFHLRIISKIFSSACLHSGANGI